jgi:hypothetical protein
MKTMQQITVMAMCLVVALSLAILTVPQKALAADPPSGSDQTVYDLIQTCTDQGGEPVVHEVDFDGDGKVLSENGEVVILCHTKEDYWYCESTGEELWECGMALQPVGSCPADDEATTAPVQSAGLLKKIVCLACCNQCSRVPNVPACGCCAACVF